MLKLGRLWFEVDEYLKKKEIKAFCVLFETGIGIAAEAAIAKAMALRGYADSDQTQNALISFFQNTLG